MASDLGDLFNKVTAIFILYIKHLLKSVYPGPDCDVFQKELISKWEKVTVWKGEGPWGLRGVHQGPHMGLP